MIRCRESIGIIVVVALLLGVLHALECTMWAFVYVYIGAFPSVADATLYSVDSIYDAREHGARDGKTVAHDGATEAGNGMLLFGISTAFLFAVMAGLWKKPIGG